MQHKLLHFRHNRGRERIKEKKFLFFFWKAVFLAAAQERARQTWHAERSIVQKDFFNLPLLAFSESFLLSLRENWGTTLSLYIHIIHTHTTQIINESVLSNERARARHGEWKTREPIIGVANYSSSRHRGAIIIIIILFFERDRYGKE